jgi:hypothetical protein
MSPTFYFALFMTAVAVAFVLFCLRSAASGILRRQYNDCESITLSVVRRQTVLFQWLFGAPNEEWLLANLPAKLKFLDMSGSDTARLPDLPSGLVRLVARDCKNLQTVARLPASIVLLDVRGCKKLSHLPSRLPASLEEMYVGATAITRLPKLTAVVRVVDANSCRNLIAVSAEWPAFTGYGGNLHWLDLSNTPVVHWIYGNLPIGAIKQLHEYGCAGYRTNNYHGTIEFAGRPPEQLDTW